MNTSLEFEPMQIGMHDTKKEKAIVEFYERLCRDASSLLYNLEFYLECPDQLNLSVFFEFLNSKNCRAFLYETWIKIHAVEIPFGLSLDKVIELDLLDVPRQKFANLLNWRKELVDLIQKERANNDRLNFYFPLQKLFDPTPDNRGFAITASGWGLQADEENEGYTHQTPEFDQALFEHVRKFTTSPQENAAIEAINKVVDSINDLIASGFIPNKRSQWFHHFENYIVDALNFDYSGTDRPLGINARLLLAKANSKFFEKRPFGGVNNKPEDIFFFQEPVDESEFE